MTTDITFELVGQNRDLAHKAFKIGYSVRQAVHRPLPLLVWYEVVGHLDRSVEALNAGVIDHHAALSGQRPACRQGCHHCCFQTIEVSSVELVRIAISLQDDPEARQALAARSAVIGARTAPLSKHDRHASAIPCPALDGTSCGIYGARPVACRTYWSLSRSACDRDWRQRAMSRQKGVPLLLHGLLGGQSLTWGFDAAFHAAGFEVVRIELSAGLAHILADPALPARWLRGERIFAAFPERRDHSYGELLRRSIEAVQKGSGDG